MNPGVTETLRRLGGEIQIPTYNHLIQIMPALYPLICERLG